jgi:hypothetical protein
VKQQYIDWFLNVDKPIQGYYDLVDRKYSFVNLFKDINNPLSHFVIGNKILENNFNFENLLFKTFLIREWQRDFISVLNDNSIKLITQGRSSKYAKRYVELHNEAQPDFKLHISNFT